MGHLSRAFALFFALSASSPVPTNILLHPRTLPALHFTPFKSNDPTLEGAEVSKEVE